MWFFLSRHSLKFYFVNIGMDVTGLTPGKKYKFRVRALNKEGESEPLETADAITAKNPFGKSYVKFISFIIISFPLF